MPLLLPSAVLIRRASPAAIENGAEEVSHSCFDSSPLSREGCHTTRAASSSMARDFGFGPNTSRRHDKSLGEVQFGNNDHDADQKQEDETLRRVCFAPSQYNSCIEITPYAEIYGMHPSHFEFDEQGCMVPRVPVECEKSVQTSTCP